MHAAIRSALDAFASEAASLAASDSLKPAVLAALVERLRFLRAVCSYHSASEDDVLFPAVRYDAPGEIRPGRCRRQRSDALPMAAFWSCLNTPCSSYKTP